MRKNTINRAAALLLTLLCAVGLLAGCASQQPATEPESAGQVTQQNAEPASKEVDYLILVNKQHPLPDDWEDRIELVRCAGNEGSYLVEKRALEAFLDLRDALFEEGIQIELDSTYRSVARQKEIWSEFEAERGVDYARQYVAVPGCSEHHTGLAIDVCLVKNGVVIDDNDDMIAERETFERIWARLPEFGFILRYREGTQDITGYAYEPWHFRYVGVEAAKEIAERGVTLEEYLLGPDAFAEVSTG